MSSTDPATPDPSAPPSDAGAPPAGGSGARRRTSRWLAPLAAVVVVAAAVLVVPGLQGRDPSSSPSPSGPSSSPTGSGPVASPSATTSGGPSGTTSASASPTGGPTGTPAPTLAHPTAPAHGPGDYLLMTRAALMARPTTGPAWEALLATANGPTGSADLTDQDERHGVIALASAIVYARTGEATYRETARVAILDVIGTERRDADNSILSLGRQLAAYVLAADFIGLDGPDDERFRAWLSTIRTEELGGHGRWRALTATHEDSANNWGAFAGASRIAASLYLADEADVARAARVLRGFLGDRSGWDAFQPVDGGRSWACDPSAYTPVNPPCTREGIDLDGAIVRDIDRGGNRRWPPGGEGVSYTLESLQGLMLQAELLYQHGTDDPWSWSDGALRRATRVVTDSGAAGGVTWNESAVSRHIPWLFNARYVGLDLPTTDAGYGRAFGYTDWLYGD